MRCTAGRPSCSHTARQAWPVIACANCCRQDAYFQYLFGAHDVEDAFGALDTRTHRAFLFVPRLPPSYAVWMGHILSPPEVQVGAAGRSQGAGWGRCWSAAGGSCPARAWHGAPRSGSRVPLWPRACVACPHPAPLCPPPAAAGQVRSGRGGPPAAAADLRQLHPRRGGRLQACSESSLTRCRLVPCLPPCRCGTPMSWRRCWLSWRPPRCTSWPAASIATAGAPSRRWPLRGARHLHLRPRRCSR